jgi:hypothetical protein
MQALNVYETGSKLAYALQVSPADTPQTQVRHSPQKFAVNLAPNQVVRWNMEQRWVDPPRQSATKDTALVYKP